jgi:hypothetical protein
MNRIPSLVLAVLLCLVAKPLRAAETISLDGEWRFALDRADMGVNEKWFARDLADKILLPGILQAQGYGDDISTDTPWVLTLGDAWWKIQPASLREHFSQPGHVEVPFLSQPPKHYLGAAWYQRDFDVPTNWSGKHFTLFLERAHWQSKVWIDDQEFPANDSLVAPHITDLGVLTPGKHRLSVRVDNRLQLPAAGHLVDSHSISDGLGAAWNGIVGKIELRATPPVWIDDVQVFTLGTQGVVHVIVHIGNITGKTGNGFLSVCSSGPFPIIKNSSVKWEKSKYAMFPINTFEFAPPKPFTNVISMSEPSHFVKWETNGGTAEFTFIKSAEDTKFWDEFHPSLLYETLYLSINNTQTTGTNDLDHLPVVTKGFGYGFRQITAQDKDILINGRPVNLRLTHDGGEFPLTGYPAMDVASWKKIIQTCKDYGLNGMRFHSWCPPEAAFEAADELGFYLQPECGLWADFGSPQMKQWLNDETARLLKAYGNHPSFILLSPSNEPRNYSRFTPQWAADNYAKDPRRLYSAGTGWSDPSQVNGGAQYASLVRFGGGDLRNTSGWFGGDYGAALQDVHIPVLAHEVGQWCAYPDFDVMKKFTGYLQPGNYDIFKYIAEHNAVLDEDKDFAWASGRFQLECYKEEIEANLRTPGLSGFQLLDLHDYLGQGTALIGVVDAFWEPKSYVTAEEFRKFCGPVVPLARLEHRIYTSDQTLESDVEIYNFGEKPITAARPQWWIMDSAGKLITNGWWEARDIPLGKNIPLGKISVDVSKFTAPAAYTLIVSAYQGDNHTTSFATPKATTLFENDWNFWLYPAQVDTNTPSDVLVTRNWSEAATRLAAGGKVLFMPGNADLDPAKCPPMRNVPVFWNIQMTVRPPANRSARFDAMLGLLCDTNSPALAEFPTDKNCDWQWTQIINGVRSVNLTAAPRELRPIVWAIDDWNRNWKLGVIFECNVSAGKLLVSAINLDSERGGSELKQLRRSLLDYMGGEKFHPAATLTPEQARGLWARSISNTNEPARVFDPDLNDGSTPQAQPKR